METEPTIPFWQEDPFSERSTKYLEYLENHRAFLEKLKDLAYRETYAQKHPAHTESVLSALKKHDDLVETVRLLEEIQALREA